MEAAESQTHTDHRQRWTMPASGSAVPAASRRHQHRRKRIDLGNKDASLAEFHSYASAMVSPGPPPWSGSPEPSLGGHLAQFGVPPAQELNILDSAALRWPNQQAPPCDRFQQGASSSFSVGAADYNAAYHNPGSQSASEWLEGLGSSTASASGGLRILAEQLVGNWADSLGNLVIVSQCDAYQMKLVATLTQPPRKDIHLTVRPLPDGGWNCGNAKLDAAWSSTSQLHWLAADGRVSVWVRLPRDGDSVENGS